MFLNWFLTGSNHCKSSTRTVVVRFLSVQRGSFGCVLTSGSSPLPLNDTQPNC